MRSLQPIIQLLALLLLLEFAAYAVYRRSHPHSTGSDAQAVSDLRRQLAQMEQSLNELDVVLHGKVRPIPLSPLRPAAPLAPTLGPWPGARIDFPARPPMQQQPQQQQQQQQQAPVLARNTELLFLNEGRFPGVVDDPATVTLVVMVHVRATALKALIDSLRAVSGIERVLLVVSQDADSAALDALVASIDFCVVLRLFLPAALELHPNSFPGTDPRDCPPRASAAQAHSLQCLNRDHPDMYGNYREAKFAVVKHHWWWKAAFVFNHIPRLAAHHGYKVFLEEDHFVLPDMLHVLSMMHTARGTLRRDDDPAFLTLGSYAMYDSLFLEENAYGGSLLRVAWDPTKHNMGLAFDRSTWDRLAACAPRFCEYDDYNRDRVCFPHGIMTLASVAPRVLHLGGCVGMHAQNKKADCSFEEDHENARAYVNRVSAALFPSDMGPVHSKAGLGARLARPNGGWGDPRDHALCKSML